MAVTLEQLSATLPCISFDSVAGFNGVGSRGAGESRSFAEDDRNRDIVLQALTASLQHIDAGEYSAPVVIMANWPMSTATFAAGATRCFCDEDQVDECEHYTQTISGGTVGCTDSHLFAWAFFAQRGLSAYGVADSLLVKALEKVSDSVASDAPNHRASNLCSVRFAPSLAHAPKGGDAGRHGRR